MVLVAQCIPTCGSVGASLCRTFRSGTVTFTDSGNFLGMSSLNGGGSAALSTSTLGVGGHFITASYGGDSNYKSSATATPLMQTVNQDTSSLGLASSVNPSVFNQAVTFTASVTPQFGESATGTVTFYDSTTLLGTAPVSGNQAKLTISTLAVGTHPITASYSGDSNVGGSTTSQALSQTVNNNNANKASTTTALTSLPPSAFVGQTITYTATVTSSYPTVTGSVSFKSGAVSLGSAPLVNGQASVTTSYSAAGSYSITAKYAGDGNNKASTSPVLKEVVTKYTTSTAVGSSQNPSIVPQTVTFTATVTTAGSPTGTVTFKSGGAALGTVSLTGITASLSTSALTAGTHNITAVYSGDGTCKASTSPALKQVVTKH